MIPSEEKLKELKAAVLAIEWEITDEAMESLNRAIKPLQAEWAGRKMLLVCLQVIGTLGQYIKKAKEKAHPDAIKLLPDVFTTLETVASDVTSDEGKKVALVRASVDKYNRLKTELAKRPKEPVQESSAGAARVKPIVETPPKEGRGGSTIRDLMDQKEDQAVDGAFNAIFQEMVADDQHTPPPAPPAAPGMPSVGGQAGPDAKEVLLAKIEDEEFPEADSLLDDFFSEDGLSLAEDEAATPPAPAPDETVAIDIGQFAEEKEKKVIPERANQFEEEEEIVVDKLARVIQKAKYGISAPLLRQLSEEIQSLRSQYSGNSSLLLFLQILEAIGSHLESYDDIAVERSCSMLQTTYDRLAHSLFTMQPQEKLLSSHLELIQEFWEWHKLVAAELDKRVTEQQEKLLEETEAELSPEMRMAVQSLIRIEMERFRQEILEGTMKN